MPRIVLRIPFIKHYAGTVFELNDPIVSSNWDLDERNREKQSRYADRVYFLPDAGHGRSAELSVSDTLICPDEVFKSIDIKTGPCRITSIKKLVNESRLSVDKLNIRLAGDSFPLNNNIILEALSDCPVDCILIFDLLIEQKIMELNVTAPLDSLSFELENPGFYFVQGLLKNNPVWEIHVYKNFPMVVTSLQNSNKFITIPTIW